MKKRILKKRAKKYIQSKSLLFDFNIYFEFLSFGAVSIFKNGVRVKNINIQTLKICILNLTKQKNPYSDLQAYYLDLKIHQEALLFLANALRISYLKNKKAILCKSF